MDTTAEPGQRSPNQQPPKRQSKIFYGWYIVAGSVIANIMTAGVYWQGFQIFFLPMLDEYGWSRAALSGAFAMRQVETGIAAPLVGVLVDRFGPRKVLISSGLILGGGIMLTAGTFSLWSFYLFFFMASIGASGISHSVTWAVVISRWFERRRGTAMGMGMSGPIFSGVVLLAMGWGVGEFGWRPTVLVAGFLLLIVVLSMSLLVRDRPQDMGLHPDGVEPEAVKEQTGRRLRYAGIAEADSFTVRQALRTRAFWTMMLLFSAMFFGVSGLQVHQVAYLQNDANLSVVEATTILSMMLLISGLGRIGVGTLTDFFDLRIVLTLLVATMSAAWCYLLVVPITNFWMGVPFAFIFGIPFGAMVAIRPILMVKLFGGRSMGSLVGIFQSGALASGVVGPVIMGLIFDVQDSYQLAVIIFMCVTLAAIPLALTVKPAAPPPHTPASPPSPELRQPPPS